MLFWPNQYPQFGTRRTKYGIPKTEFQFSINLLYYYQLWLTVKILKINHLLPFLTQIGQKFGPNFLQIKCAYVTNAILLYLVAISALNEKSLLLSLFFYNFDLIWPKFCQTHFFFVFFVLLIFNVYMLQHSINTIKLELQSSTKVLKKNYGIISKNCYFGPNLGKTWVKSRSSVFRNFLLSKYH